MVDSLSIFRSYFEKGIDPKYANMSSDERRAILMESSRDTAHHMLDQYYELIGIAGEVTVREIAHRKVVLGLMISSRYGVEEGIEVIEAAIKEFEK